MATRPRQPRATAKSEPFTVRFDRATQAAIEDEAGRTRRTRTAVIEELVDEAFRTRRFPGIGFRDSFPRRRPWLIRAGLDVWEACDLVDRYPDVETLLADFPQLDGRQVDLALAYREAYPDEIAEALAENARTAEDWRRAAPFVRPARR